MNRAVFRLFKQNVLILYDYWWLSSRIKHMILMIHRERNIRTGKLTTGSWFVLTDGCHMLMSLIFSSANHGSNQNSEGSLIWSNSISKVTRNVAVCILGQCWFLKSAVKSVDAHQLFIIIVGIAGAMDLQLERDRTMPHFLNTKWGRGLRSIQWLSLSRALDWCLFTSESHL